MRKVNALIDNFRFSKSWNKPTKSYYVNSCLQKKPAEIHFKPENENPLLKLTIIPFSKTQARNPISNTFQNHRPCIYQQ